MDQRRSQQHPRHRLRHTGRGRSSQLLQPYQDGGCTDERQRILRRQGGVPSADEQQCQQRHHQPGYATCRQPTPPRPARQGAHTRWRTRPRCLRGDSAQGWKGNLRAFVQHNMGYLQRCQLRRPGRYARLQPAEDHHHRVRRHLMGQGHHRQRHVRRDTGALRQRLLREDERQHAAQHHHQQQRLRHHRRHLRNSHQPELIHQLLYQLRQHLGQQNDKRSICQHHHQRPLRALPQRSAVCRGEGSGVQQESAGGRRQRGGMGRRRHLHRLQGLCSPQRREGVWRFPERRQSRRERPPSAALAVCAGPQGIRRPDQDRLRDHPADTQGVARVHDQGLQGVVVSGKQARRRFEVQLYHRADQ